MYTYIMNIIIAAEFKVGGLQCWPRLHSMQTTLSIMLLEGLGHTPPGKILKICPPEIESGFRFKKL